MVKWLVGWHISNACALWPHHTDIYGIAKLWSSDPHRWCFMHYFGGGRRVGSGGQSAGKQSLSECVINIGANQVFVDCILAKVWLLYCGRSGRAHPESGRVDVLRIWSFPHCRLNFRVGWRVWLEVGLPHLFTLCFLINQCSNKYMYLVWLIYLLIVIPINTKS